VRYVSFRHNVRIPYHPKIVEVDAEEEYVWMILMLISCEYSSSWDDLIQSILASDNFFGSDRSSGPILWMLQVMAEAENTRSDCQ